MGLILDLIIFIMDRVPFEDQTIRMLHVLRLRIDDLEVTLQDRLNVIETVIAIVNGAIGLLVSRHDVLVHGVILNPRFPPIGLIVGKRMDISINREVDPIRTTKRMIRKVVALLPMESVDFIQSTKLIYSTLLDYTGLMEVFSLLRNRSLNSSFPS